MDEEIHLREILYRHEDLFFYTYEGEKFRGRRDDELERWKPGFERSINDLVQEFFEDIFIKKLGV